MNTGAKPQKTTKFAKSKHVSLAAHAPHKGGGGTPPTGGIKKPKKHKPEVIALHEIHWFQKSVDMLIPLLSFGHVICEVAQDYKVGLRFQSSALMEIQEAAETYLVNLFLQGSFACFFSGCAINILRDFGECCESVPLDHSGSYISISINIYN